jgi:purine nucleoside permease
MAFGLDQRFDLRKAYWIVADVAGVDSTDASLGSAAWTEWVVDGDLGLDYEIDARNARRVAHPLCAPRQVHALRTPRPEDHGEAYYLSGKLAEWSSHLTEHVDPGDTPEMQKDRALYVSANAL